MSFDRIIAITRQYGSGGHDIGKALAEKLGISFYDKELISIAAKESGVSPEVFKHADERATNSLLYSLSVGLYNYGNNFSSVGDLPVKYRHFSSLIKEVYNPKTFILHAALLRQGCPHCAISPTAASRRSLGRVSVPMWPFNLSVRLPIVALVGHYLTN